MMQITLKWNETFDYLVLVYYYVKNITNKIKRILNEPNIFHKIYIFNVLSTHEL